LSASSGIPSDFALEKVRYSLVDGVDRAAERFVDISMLGVKQIGLCDKDSHLHVEDAIGSLIKSIAVFVGISWEKAFSVAENIVVQKVPLLMDHQVVSKVSLALLVCAFMLPGWYWYIMPKALMDRGAHKEHIDLELTQEKAHRRGQQVAAPASDSRGCQPISLNC